MNKSTKKTINYLKRYTGLEVIRTKPSSIGDWCYTKFPVILLGFTSDGKIRCKYSDDKKSVLGEEEMILSEHYTDRNWITYKKALRAKHNVLNKWRGKKVKRIHPTKYIEDHSYMCTSSFNKPPTLISASKYHMVIELNDEDFKKGKRVVLRPDFINPKDWIIVED